MENSKVTMTFEELLEELESLEDVLSDEELDFLYDRFFEKRRDDPNTYYGILGSHKAAEEFRQRCKEDEARAKINEEKKAKALAEGKSNTISTLSVIGQIAGIFLL